MTDKISLSNLTFYENETPFFADLVHLKMPKRPVYGNLLERVGKNDKVAYKYKVKDADTGKVFGVTRTQLGFYVLKDDAEFLKIFTEPLYSAIELSPTARRVFDAIIEVYGKEPMHNGYVDCFYFKWYVSGVNGGHTEKTRMSRGTYTNGMCELLQKKFIAPRRPDIWWPNPLIFFKGNRAKYLEALLERQEKKGEHDDN